MPLIPFCAARRSLLRFADGLRAVDFFKAAAVIFGVGLLSAAWAESPDIAGRVQFVVGEVSAADRDGAARALGKRDDIFEGDTVTTGPSASAQIMMIDGARIAVRPNSAFMVNEYRAPSADDIGASILTLLKGGFRTLSGLIGEESARYRIDTPCCSIGLRGTDHAVFHIPEGEENAYGGGEAGTYNRVYKGATFLESAGVTLDITPQTDAGFAARGQPPVFVPDIPETAEGAVVLAPSEDEDEESDDSEAAENESEESESEDESESETETAETDDSESDDADADDSNSETETAETDDSESETADADDSNSETETAETADTGDSNSETETAETADADDSNSGSDDAVLAESPADESSSEIDDAVIVESPADESSSEIDDAVLAESPADESTSEIDNAGLAESPADESPSEIDNAGLVESPGELSSALETVEIAIESAAPPIADFQNPADIADALQRENTMPEPEPPSPVISLTSDLTMLQEGGQVILRVSSDIPARPGGLMVTINIGTAMAGEFGISGGVCSALECVVTIPAGMTEAELILTPISDTAMESAERWTATLVDGGLNYNIDDTMMAVGFDISDQPVIGIATADMAMVREGGEIRLTVSSDIAAPSGGLLVTINIGTAMAGEFGISGGVCSALECVVTIPAGMTEAELILTPISDTAMESAERWTATLVDGGLNYNIDDTMMAVGFDISDQPVIGIATADMAMVREGGEIRLTVSSDIAAPSGGLLVTINIGTAMAGEFGISGGVCSALECVVTIPAGMTEAELILTPISDSVNEDLENWMATLGDGGLNYNIDNTMMNVGFDISDPHLNLRQNVGTTVGEHDIALQWDAHPDATGYRVSRGGTEIGDVTGTSFTQSLQVDGDYGDHHYRVVPYDSGGDITDFAVDTLAVSSDGFLDATISSRLSMPDLLDPALLAGGSIATDPNFPVNLEFIPSPLPRFNNDFVIAQGQTYGEQQSLSTVDGVQYPLFGTLRRFHFGSGQRLAGDSSIIRMSDSGQSGFIFVAEGQSFSGSLIMRMFYRLQIGDRVMLKNYYLSMEVGDFFMGVANVDDVALTGPETFFRVVGGGDCVFSNNLRCSKQSGSSGVEGLASFGLPTENGPFHDGTRAFTRFDLQRNDGNRISGRFAPDYNIRSAALGAPTNLMGIVNPDGSVSLLDWGSAASINPEYFKIYRNGVEIGFGRLFVSSISGCAGDTLSFSSSRCTDSGTTPGATHRYTVSSVDRFGRESPMSDPLEFTIPVPVIGIATADMAMVREGGEIRLTVSSDIPARPGGLMVTINIGTAMAGEFGITGGVCSALECVVVIPAGMLAATLTITPISDSVNEDLENWMATLGDGGLNYNIDNTMMNVGFDISDPHLNLQQDIGTAVGEHDIALQWEAHPDATGYRVSRRGTEIGDVTGTSFTHSLQVDGDNGDHHYRIVPYDSNGDITDFAVDILAARPDDFAALGYEWDPLADESVFLRYHFTTTSVAICCIAATSFGTISFGTMESPRTDIRKNEIGEILAYSVSPEGERTLLGSVDSADITDTANGIEWNPVMDDEMNPADLYEIVFPVGANRRLTSVGRDVSSASIFDFGFRAKGFGGRRSGGRYRVFPRDSSDTSRQFPDINSRETGDITRHLPANLPRAELLDPAELVGAGIRTLRDFPIGFEFEESPFENDRRVIYTRGQMLGEQENIAVVEGEDYSLLSDFDRSLFSFSLGFSGNAFRLDEDSIWVGGVINRGGTLFRGRLALVLEGPAFSGSGFLSGRSGAIDQDSEVVAPFLFYRLEVGDRVMLRNYYLSMEVDDFFMGVTNVEDVALTGPETFFRVVGGADCRLSSGSERCSKQSGPLGVEGLASFGLPISRFRERRAFTRFDLRRDDGSRISGRYVPSNVDLSPVGLQRLSSAPDNFAGSVNPLGGVMLSWDKSFREDYYAIFRDGVEIGVAKTRSGFECIGDSLSTGSGGCVDRGATPGATHEYTISAVDYFGRESPTSDPLEFTIPAAADLPPPFDSLAEPSDWIIGGDTGIMAMRPDSDVLAAGEQFSAFAPADGSYVGFRIGDATANSRVVVFRTDLDGTGGFSAAGAQINDFDFRYAIETGDVNVLTDYNVQIDLDQGGGNEIWNFGLGSNRRVNLIQAETGFRVSGTAAIGSSMNSASGAASFGTDNANVYSRFDVEDRSNARLLGQFSVPALPTP